MHIAIIERVTRRLAFTVKSPKLNEKEKEEKKKKQRATSCLYLKWRRREGGLSKVFETDEGGGGQGGEGGGGGGWEGKLGGHIKTARGHRCWIIWKAFPSCAPPALTNRSGDG